MFDITFTTKTSVLSAYTTHQVLFLSDLSWSWLIQPTCGRAMTCSWLRSDKQEQLTSLHAVCELDEHIPDTLVRSGTQQFCFLGLIYWFVFKYTTTGIRLCDLILRNERHLKKKQNFKVIKQLHAEFWRSLHKSLKAKKSETAGCHHTVSWSNLQ